MWMLTGDKQETAINIGHACRLLKPNMELLVINEDSLDVCRKLFWNFALRCDMKKDFLQLRLQCKAVVCCRVTPSQKAEIVEAVTQETQSVTLAIGDGANDVAMIQKAHVGVGISGMEGLQVACASD
jgi:phospholipid-transporting ATPase